MEKNQLEKIKVAIYKQKPFAHLCYVTKNGLVYTSDNITNENNEVFVVMFVVPLEDIGDGKFDPKMDGKLLIRYINTINKVIDN